MEKDKIPCIRCGVCCSSGVCPHGIEDSYGMCAYLIINDKQNGKQTSCKLLLENRINPKDIGIGIGCILRELYIVVYNYYHSQMMEKLESKNMIDDNVTNEGNKEDIEKTVRVMNATMLVGEVKKEK